MVDNPSDITDDKKVKELLETIANSPFDREEAKEIFEQYESEAQTHVVVQTWGEEFERLGEYIETGSNDAIEAWFEDKGVDDFRVDRKSETSRHIDIQFIVKGGDIKSGVYKLMVENEHEDRFGNKMRPLTECYTFRIKNC